MMRPREVVTAAVTSGGFRSALEGWQIQLELWLRLPKRERNRLENLGKVERE